MNAPYDGDRGQAAGSPGHPEGPPPEHGQVPPQHPADMYLQDAYEQDPYRAQDLAAQDPVAEALYDRAAHPPPPPGTYPSPQQLYAQPPQSPYAPRPARVGPDTGAGTGGAHPVPALRRRPAHDPVRRCRRPDHPVR
ncbi:hypothetical protein GCM10020295_41770 [Streptomyces cinereospinus]